MALTDESGMVMPVAPMYGGNNSGFGGLGGDWGWIVLLLLICGGGGWGFGGGFGGGFGNMMLGYDFPWLFNGQQNIMSNTNNGFRDQMINDGINGIRSDINGISTQLCNGFAGVEQGANSRQIANMQTAFDLQNTVSTGFNNVGLQLCQASGENRLATANLGADIAREACATRTSDTQNTQVILNAINDGFRLMSDQRYQDKIDAKNDEIAQLRQEVLFARGKDSQDVQTANIIDGTYRRLSDCPVNTTPVYGRTPIFTCNQNNCGCGNNGFYN